MPKLKSVNLGRYLKNLKYLPTKFKEEVHHMETAGDLLRKLSVPLGDLVKIEYYTDFMRGSIHGLFSK